MVGCFYKKVHVALYVRLFIDGFQGGLRRPPLAYYLTTVTDSLNEAILYYSLCVMASNFAPMVCTLIIGPIYDKKRSSAKIIHLFFVVVKLVGYLLYIVSVAPWMVVVSKLLSGSATCLQIIFISEVSRLEGKHERIAVASTGQSLDNIGMIIGVLGSLILSFFEVNFTISIFKFNPGTITLYICVVSSVIEFIIYCIVIKNDDFLQIQNVNQSDGTLSKEKDSSIFSNVATVFKNNSFLGYYISLFLCSFITSTLNVFAQAIMLSCFHSKTRIQSIRLLLIPSLRIAMLSLISFVSKTVPGSIIISFSWIIQAFLFLSIPISWYFLDSMQCYTILASHIIIKALGKALIKSVMVPELGCILPNNLKATGQSVSRTLTSCGRILAKPLASVSLASITLSGYSIVFGLIQIITAISWNVTIHLKDKRDKENEVKKKLKCK